MAVSSGGLKKIKSCLDSLILTKCWAVFAGPGTGSMVSMDFGQRVRRSVPLKNPTLSSSQREFEGEIKIFIQNAQWELLQKGTRICNSDDDNRIDGPIVSGLSRLIGKQVHTADVISHFGDLEIGFGDGFQLKITCARIAQDSDCYSLFSPRSIATLNGVGLVEIEDREQSGTDHD